LGKLQTKTTGTLKRVVCEMDTTVKKKQRGGGGLALGIRGENRPKSAQRSRWTPPGRKSKPVVVGVTKKNVQRPKTNHEKKTSTMRGR